MQLRRLASCWPQARLARQASRKRWAQSRDQNSTRCWARSLTHAARRGKILLSDRRRLFRLDVLGREGKKHSAGDSSLKEALTTHFKPPEPTFCRGCHLPAHFHTQIPAAGIHVLTPSSPKADRSTESACTPCFLSYQVQVPAGPVQFQMRWESVAWLAFAENRPEGGERGPPGMCVTTFQILTWLVFASV